MISRVITLMPKCAGGLMHDGVAYQAEVFGCSLLQSLLPWKAQEC